MLQTTSKSSTILTKSTNIDRVINLFEQFVAIFGAKWTAHLPVERKSRSLAVQKWEEAISDLSDEQIKFAVNECMCTMTWCPTISDFRRVAIGVIAEDDAFLQAQEMQYGTRKEISKIIDHCRRRISSWDWSNLDNYELRRKFGSIYSEEIKNILIVKC